MATFAHLWKNFPCKETMQAACTNRQPDSNQPFSDYCAIMLSECLNRSAIPVGAFRGNRCWSHGGLKHILLAQDLANGLKTMTPREFSPMVKISPPTFQDDLKGKTGVIFFPGLLAAWQ